MWTSSCPAGHFENDPRFTVSLKRFGLSCTFTSSPGEDYCRQWLPVTEVGNKRVPESSVHIVVDVSLQEIKRWHETELSQYISCREGRHQHGRKTTIQPHSPTFGELTQAFLLLEGYKQRAK